MLQRLFIASRKPLSGPLSRYPSSFRSVRALPSDSQLEHIRSRVMACDVEREAFLDGSLCFNFRRDEGFFTVDRIDQVAPIRTDDCAASIQQHVGLPFQFITQFILPGKTCVSRGTSPLPERNTGLQTHNDRLQVDANPFHVAMKRRE